MDPALVSRDPEIMSGALCFAGTRVPVKNLFDYLEGSSSLEDFLEDFPSVSRERAVGILEAAGERLLDECGRPACAGHSLRAPYRPSARGAGRGATRRTRR
jgi:uncharacterized protein (DUF433 family)